MIDLGIPQSEIKSLTKAIVGTSRKLDRELTTAINATARKTKTAISREIRRELAAPAKAVNRVIGIKTKATRGTLSATVELKESARISLKEFTARQTRKGVSYRTSKSGGRKTIQSAFKGPNGHIFKRSGPSRLPIKKLHGPSPWGVFVVQGLRSKIKSDANAELIKQVQRRVRFLLLKQTGEI